MRISLQKRNPLLHRKSHDDSAMDLCSNGGDNQFAFDSIQVARFTFHRLETHIALQEMLRRHGAKSISVPLGAYGAKSECFGFEGKQTCSRDSMLVTGG